MVLHRRDWILRQVEQIAEVLARLLGRILRRELSGDEVRAELDAVGRSLGLDMELAHRVSAETLLLLVSPTGDIEPARCWLFAETFYLEGLQAHLNGDGDEASDLLARARLLFQAMADGELRLPGMAEAGERVREIDRILATTAGS